LVVAAIACDRTRVITIGVHKALGPGPDPSDSKLIGHYHKRAGLRSIGSHVLRHTFCSHLAMRCAAPKAIQELVGHSTLTMTLRYMHLAPSALTEAIDLLNFGQPVGGALSRSV
jgi:integrase